MIYSTALPETNIEPENRPGPQKATSIPTIHFHCAILASGSLLITLIENDGYKGSLRFQPPLKQLI